ncbi:hypothetical protein [Sphaerisporangium corydalis]|uniref:UDP-N-acetylglucosamine 2-epimerase domain-containing protein n=1 Tax=Sphaerisporangium corydalis TaxID=1441875 RepID=A0ABV9E5N0_9ACTN|nr:hypothetical protein [Sphaerisporangium corydalis]
MSGQEWREVPIGLDAHRWVTRPDCKAVLAVVHTVTSGQRLLDTMRLVESDLRVQVVFTMAPDVFGNGVAEFIDGLGVVQLPWHQATRQRFDLALAASLGAIHQLHAPLIVMQHGAGFNKLVRGREGLRAVGGSVAYGLDAQRLVHDGAVIPSAIVLAHRSDLGRLGRTCPEAVPAAAVVGDPSYDRLTASLAHRATYREALAVGPDQTLVVVCSTWGPLSLFGRRSELFSRLVSELPRCRFRVVALFHPNVWFGHGVWQVRTWLADCLRKGLSLVPPEADWRSVLAAADLIIGDHGSATLYGTVTGAPVMLASVPESEVDPASPFGALAAVAPRLSPHESLLEQLTRARDETQEGRYKSVAELITSAPGRFDRNMRHLMYRLMRLKQPATITPAAPGAVPFLLSRWSVHEAPPAGPPITAPVHTCCADCATGAGASPAEETKRKRSGRKRPAS